MDRPKLVLRLLEWLFNRKQDSGGQKVSPTVVGDNNIVLDVTINFNIGKD